MKYRFENKEIVQYDDSFYGKGKGSVVGYSKSTDEYIIYPRIEGNYIEEYPFMCFLTKSENLISTPF